jgi:hypothetical protein
MTSTPSGVLEAVERILNRGGDRDEVLRRVVEALHRVYPYVRVGELEIGEPAEPTIDAGALRVGGGPADRAIPERIGLLISSYL